MDRRDPKKHIKRRRALTGFLLGSWTYVLLVFVPISLAIEPLGLPKFWAFIASALAIVPLAGLIGEATEDITREVGPGVGGLLNATFGNATELIIAFFALRAGLQNVVKASLAGSIIGNILLVLGVSMLAGGWGRDRQIFNRTRAGTNAAMLFLAVVALVMPAVFDLAVFGTLKERGTDVEQVSLLVSIVLLITYLGSLVFSLRTHRDLITTTPPEEQQARLTRNEALLFLVAATAVVAVESEILVGAIDEATTAFGISQFFVGMVVVAVVGNAAEYASAVLMAMRNRMETAVTIATGSGTQIALFVAPILVLISFSFGQPMSLVFNAFEIVGVSLAVIAVSVVTLDGESTWFEGLQLIAVYLVMAVVFYFVPSA